MDNNELLKSIDDLELKIRHVKTILLTPQPAQPERTPRLVDAVDNVLELTKNARFSLTEWNLLADACDAEKKRRELVDDIVIDVRFAIENGILGENCALAHDLRRLEAFDKERGV